MILCDPEFVQTVSWVEKEKLATIGLNSKLLQSWVVLFIFWSETINTLCTNKDVFYRNKTL